VVEGLMFSLVGRV